MSNLDNLLSQKVLMNPYPFYHRLQSEDPVHLDPLLGGWLVTRYADVMAAFSNLHLSSERMKGSRSQSGEWEKLQGLFQTVSKQMVFLDPPDHTRIRALIYQAFTPRKVEAMRPRIQMIMDRLLALVKSAGQMEVIQDLAYPLPATVIAEMLGTAAEDHDKIKQWSRDFAVFMGNPPTLETARQAQQSVGAFIDYFSYLVALRRRDPKDDLLSALVHAEGQQDVLSEEELLANCVLLIFAGHETTTNLIGNGLLALLQHPNQLERLESDWSLITSAVEELLRYDSPTQWTARVAKEGTTIGGKKIGRGQGVLLMLGAANRDPAQFPDPDRLDVARKENQHLAFGHSRHFCIGAPLARLEGKIAVETVFRHLPLVKLGNETLEWRGNSALRALKSLYVTF